MARLDRVATLYFGRPFARVFGPKKGTSAPILMYHSVSENLFGKSHPYFQINTTPEVFAQQMRWLRCAGYHSLSVTELLRALENGEDVSKAVVITFDDGYRDFYTDAMDAIRQCGLKATIYLATDRIKDHSLRFEGVDYLTWREVRELHKEGIEFGSHTVTHPDLRSLGPEQIEYELAYSKEMIEDKLGVATESFAYPYAFPEQDRQFTKYMEDVLSNCGFENGVCTMLGRASATKNRFFLPRIPVNSWDDEKFFLAKLEGGYDWMHWPQSVKKSFDHNLPLMERSGSARYPSQKLRGRAAS